MTMDIFAQFFTNSITFGTVIMFGAIGEIITEKAGHLNLGTPGIMYIGAISSLVGAFFYEQSVSEVNAVIAVLVALICGMLGSLLAGLVYSVLTISFRANQNVTGLALTIFGSGVANFFGGSLKTIIGSSVTVTVKRTSSAFCTSIPFLSTLGDYIGKLFFNYSFMVYAAIIIALVAQRVLNKSRVGLNLRSVGEDPGTADAAGINVVKYKYLATCIGSVITGLGGVYFVMDYQQGAWANDQSLEGYGWLALALVIFASWKPKISIFSAYLFAALLRFAQVYVVQMLPSLKITTATQLFLGALPYVVTIFVLVLTSLRNKKEDQPPASLGLPYFREER